MTKNVFLLPGQGSQYYQMGAGLYKNEEGFKALMDELDRLAQTQINRSIVDILYNENREKSQAFTQTLYTHPAIFMVEYCLAKTLMDAGIIPHYLIGASLGEYVALALAKVLPVEEILGLLIHHAKMVEANCEPGSMIGIVGDPDLYGREPILHGNSSLAGVSSPRHFVIAGFREKLDIIKNFLGENQILYQELPISHGFHSPNIYPAFESFNHNFQISPLKVPEIDIILCLTGEKLDFIEPGYLLEIAKKPVQFPRALTTLCRGGENYNYIDLGPDGTYAGFTRQNRVLGENSKIFRIMTPSGNEMHRFEKIKDELGG
ncbi:MAG: acyltransferase domain-containing protein [Desulfobacteraceae bacterium]|nr:acyltransferase domain-containing protein [Desulfobacteraceae bacterium]